MTHQPDILCIGAAHWDIIGRSRAHLRPGDDVPGTICRAPGGVALNIALSLAQSGHRPALLAAIGRDADGDALILALKSCGVDTAHVFRPDHLPTDSYMAIEGANGLVAAIAATSALETAGDTIIAPLSDGRLGSAHSPWPGTVVLDSGLEAGLLCAMANAGWLGLADLRLTAASPAKAARLTPFLGRARTVFYLNLAEAEQLCDARFPDSKSAAMMLVERGAARVLVTDGANPATDAAAAHLITIAPRPLTPQRVTGAGDRFMAAHIALEARGLSVEDALESALSAAATYISQPIQP